MTVNYQPLIDIMVGEWHLDYSRGQEDVRIDNDLNYFVRDKSGKYPATPTFKLVIIATSVDFSKVEIGKDRLDGRRLHNETLAVSKSLMEGVAKHDQHRLVYTRR